MRILQTKRLILRPFCAQDAAAMYRNWTYDERVAKYCRWYPHENLQATEALLHMYLAKYESECAYCWAIVLRGENEPIGAIDVVGTEDDGKTAEIGYVLSYDYWNRGYMSEVLSAVIRALFDDDFMKITATHHVDNPASGKVMEKCGMRYTHGKQAQEKFGSDKLCDVKCYALTKAEWLCFEKRTEGESL